MKKYPLDLEATQELMEVLRQVARSTEVNDIGTDPVLFEAINELGFIEQRYAVVIEDSLYVWTKK